MKDLNESLCTYYSDTDTTLPAYMRAAYSVKVAMANGLLKPGQPVPSTKELSDLFGINPMTASKAMGDLSRLGLIDRDRGKSYVVMAGAGEVAREEAEQNFKDITLRYLVNTMKHFDISRSVFTKWIKEAGGE